jgi:hypothetical protein
LVLSPTTRRGIGLSSAVVGDNTNNGSRKV